MKASLIQIGNSRGVRIPKAFLEQAGLRDEIEIEVHGSQVVIRPVSHPRAGWDVAFGEMALRGDDALLDSIGPSRWDESEWVW
jgi:antitoxin MazE